ncbi:MAG: nitrilase-related carbon-nitrogen hydrolase [Rhodospirillaceae bacterium]|nr:nitrilase-related carbon-nitrogen hydrolase [Rhodospirillaceae bacterium]
MTTTDRRSALAAAAAASLIPSAHAEEIGAPKVVKSMTGTGRKIQPYRASCVQTRVVPTFDTAGKFRAEALEMNLKRVTHFIERGADEVGSKLYSFSEFCLQAAENPTTIKDWMNASLRIPGPETDRIAKAAQKAKAFVGINTTEVIDAFPGRYFLSGVIFGPSGDIVLTYRKHYDLTTKTRPGDVWTAWRDKMGPDSVFPVADTEIGRLASIVALDVNWPEMARGFVFNGAEVLLNPTASPLPPGAATPDIRNQIRRVRAFENMAYVLLSNLGPVGEDESAPLQPRVPSEIVDYLGKPLATAADGGEGFVTAMIDIDALRKARTTPSAQNWLAEIQAPLHLPSYQSARFFPMDSFAKAPMESPRDYDPIKAQAIADLVARGVIKAPGA